MCHAWLEEERKLLVLNHVPRVATESTPYDPRVADEIRGRQRVRRRTTRGQARPRVASKTKKKGKSHSHAWPSDHVWPSVANPGHAWSSSHAWPGLATRGRTATRGCDLFPFLLFEATRGCQNQGKRGKPRKVGHVWPQEKKPR